MFDSFFTKLVYGNPRLKSIVFPPEHVRDWSVGKIFDECLRELERKNNLPRGDLYADLDQPMEVSSFPLGLRSTTYPILSKTSESWKNNPLKSGYIAGSILQAKRELLGFNVHASIHISRNCPGVYSNGRCTGCGDNKG